MTASETLTAKCEELGLTMEAKFIPWSQSRNKGEKQPSLNWKVTLLLKGKSVLTTDYMAGSGHCPSYRQLVAGQYLTGQQQIMIRRECETGRNSGHQNGARILPKLADVVHSLVSDADAIDYGSFEDWADSFGYDTDSRSAEKTYRACVEMGLKLRAALGEAALNELREAARDY